MGYRLLLFGMVCGFEAGWALSWADKMIFYQDCEIFNDPDHHGGQICGNNGVTYANSLYLDCVNYHTFQNVTTLHPGACLPLDEYCQANLFYRPVCGSDGNTYTNFESLFCVNYKRSRRVTVASEGRCKNLDRCSGHFYKTSPVCGSDGFTYPNAGRFKCLQRRNTDLRMLHRGGCTTRDVRKVYTDRDKVCEIAKTRHEWNPVCTLDGLIYSNPFQFLCYEADLVPEDNCETSMQHSCAQLELVDTASKNSNESFTPDDEVCGSDGVTYQSARHLQCYSGRNKYLFMRHQGPCEEPHDDPCDLIPDEDHRNPVCGSDRTSYVSPEALWCAKLRFTDKELTPVHDGPCQATSTGHD